MTALAFEIGRSRWIEPTVSVRPRPQVKALTLASRTPGVGREAVDLLRMERALQAETSYEIVPLMPEWLEAVYTSLAEERTDDAMDTVFARIDDLLVDGRFSEVDSLLPLIDLSRLDTNLVIAFLSITLAAKGRLEGRAAFFERSIARLEELAPDRVDSLLRGLD